MDAIDRDIVRLLRANGRINQERVASVVGLSRPAVHERVKRLEECGVIRSYEALVDWDAIGLPVAAFVWLRTAGEARCRDVGLALMRLSGETAMVQECHTVTGEWCLLLKVRAASPLALQDLLDTVRDVPGIAATSTTVALSTVGEHGSVLHERPLAHREGATS